MKLNYTDSLIELTEECAKLRKLNEYLNQHVEDMQTIIDSGTENERKLKLKIKSMEDVLIKLVDDDCNEWYRYEILGLLNGDFNS